MDADPEPPLPRWAEWLIRGTAIVLLVACSGAMAWACVKWWEARPTTAWGWALLLVPMAWGVYRIYTRKDPNG